jgi:hypothetical protein
MSSRKSAPDVLFQSLRSKKAPNTFFLACIHLHVGKNVRLFNRVLQEQNKHFFPMSRVTRLADFSHIRLLFSFGSFLKIAEIAQFYDYFVSTFKMCVNFWQKWARLHFGRFFTNSSGPLAQVNPTQGDQMFLWKNDQTVAQHIFCQN